MNQDAKFHYSIIIPHHNLPSGLKVCLQSIPCRKDVQVVVVDDASDDDVVSVLKLYEKDFPNVQFVYSTTNGFGGKARNIGLHYALGKYVIFSDCDDFFTSVFNDVLDDYQHSDIDLVFFKVNQINAESLTPTETPHHLNSYVDLWDSDPQTSELHLRYMFGEPWCKMIKRSVIEDHRIRFDEVRINNDTTFSYLVGYYSKTVAVDKRAIYNYLIRSGSTSRQRDTNRFFIKIDVFGRSSLFFIKHNIPLREERHYLALSGLLKHYDFTGFKKGFKQLESIGYKKPYLRKQYALTMSYCKFLVPLWNVLFAPDLVIKAYCLYYWFVISIPRFVRYKILKKANTELKRY